MLPTRTGPPCPSAAESGSYQSIAAITVAVAMTGILASAVFVATYIALGWLLPHP
jgi:hypothetical protein